MRADRQTGLWAYLHIWGEVITVLVISYSFCVFIFLQSMFRQKSYAITKQTNNNKQKDIFSFYSIQWRLSRATPTADNIGLQKRGPTMRTDNRPVCLGVYVTLYIYPWFKFLLQCRTASARFRIKRVTTANSRLLWRMQEFSWCRNIRRSQFTHLRTNEIHRHFLQLQT